MQKLWLSFATGFLLLGALSAPAEAGFSISTGYNNHSAWGSVAELSPYFVSDGYLRGLQPPKDPNPKGNSGNNGMGDINPVLAIAMGVNNPNSFLTYKDNQGGSEEGSAAILDAYSTSYSNNIRNATISHDPNEGARIYTHVPTYLFIKDGDADPYWYLFDITNRWNGTDNLVMTDFFPTHSISHVSIYGGTLDSPPGGLTAVPEPASMAVWGSVLAVGAFMRRRRRTNS